MKKCKYISFIVCVTVFSLLVCSLPAYATNQTNSVSITPVIQAKTYWCWAACCQMVGKNANSSSTRTQNDVVKYIYGSEVDDVSDAETTASGATYAAKNARTYSYGNKRTFEQINASIVKGYALIAGLANSSTGHMVTIYGTQFIDNASGSSYYIDYVDPADGSRNHCTYSSFEDGSYNGLKYRESVFTS